MGAKLLPISMPRLLSAIEPGLVFAMGLSIYLRLASNLQSVSTAQLHTDGRLALSVGKLWLDPILLGPTL